MSRKCNVCGKPRSKYIMNNKAVCMRCDELLFDLEIECDEPEKTSGRERGTTATNTIRKVAAVTKK